MSFFRSERMELYKLIFERNDRWSAMEFVGTLGALHFVDVNPPGAAKPEFKMLMRCDECEKMVTYLQRTSRENGIVPAQPLTYEEANEEIAAYSRHHYESSNVDYNSFFDQLEAGMLKRTVNCVQENALTLGKLHSEVVSLQMWCAALGASEQMFARARANSISSLSNAGGDNIDDAYEMARSIAIVSRESSLGLQKLLFRAMKGNVFVSVQEMPEPVMRLDGKREYKEIVMMIFAGGKNTSERVERVCRAYADLYFEVPENAKGEKAEKMARLRDVMKTKEATKKFLVDTLETAVNGSENLLRLDAVRFFVNKFRTMHTTLDKMVVCGGVYEGLCWCSEKDQERVITDIKSKGSKRIHFMRIPVRPNYPAPPTQLRSNDFLNPFQAIINTYGVPGYQEANPGLFAVITFPFMFGIMFGDVLHGLIILMVGVYLLWVNKKSLSQSGSYLSHIWQYRYLVLLLGLFSVYCGFVYNEMGSLAMPLFRTCYTKERARVQRPCTYPLGLDPIWGQSSNELIFVNSYKMKFAIVAAFVHMMLGLVLKGLNGIHLGDPVIIFCEVIPELLFSLSIIGYLCLLIVYKWASAWPDPAQAPSILSMIFQVFLHPGKVTKETTMFGESSQLMINISLLCMVGD